MTGARPKAKFYAVTNGRENGVFTNWTIASYSVLGFAQAKYKGFCTYSEAAAAMEFAGMTAFCVYDGQDSISRTEYENTRMKSVLKPLEIKNPISAVTSERICELSEANAASKTCDSKTCKRVSASNKRSVVNWKLYKQVGFLQKRNPIRGVQYFPIPIAMNIK